MVLDYRKLFFMGMGLFVSCFSKASTPQTENSFEFADSLKANDHLWWNHA